MCIILWSYLGRSLRSLRFGPGECFGFYFSVVCSVLALRPKDLPLALLLDGFLPAADPMEGDDRLGDARYTVLSVLSPSRRAQNRANMKTSAQSRYERLADLRGADPRGARGSPT
jgi:hypothetical protein